jgi:hypothetical protein
MGQSVIFSLKSISIPVSVLSSEGDLVVASTAPETFTGSKLKLSVSRWSDSSLPRLSEFVADFCPSGLTSMLLSTGSNFNVALSLIVGSKLTSTIGEVAVGGSAGIWIGPEDRDCSATTGGAASTVAATVAAPPLRGWRYLGRRAVQTSGCGCC